MNKKGFTLIEFIMGMAIIMIIAAVTAGILISLLYLVIYIPQRIQARTLAQQAMDDLIEGGNPTTDGTIVRGARSTQKWMPGYNYDWFRVQFNYDYGYPMRTMFVWGTFIPLSVSGSPWGWIKRTAYFKAADPMRWDYSLQAWTGGHAVWCYYLPAIWVPDDYSSFSFYPQWTGRLSDVGPLLDPSDPNSVRPTGSYPNSVAPGKGIKIAEGGTGYRLDVFVNANTGRIMPCSAYAAGSWWSYFFLSWSGSFTAASSVEIKRYWWLGENEWPWY